MNLNLARKFKSKRSHFAASVSYLFKDGFLSVNNMEYSYKEKLGDDCLLRNLSFMVDCKRFDKAINILGGIEGTSFHLGEERLKMEKDGILVEIEIHHASEGLATKSIEEPSVSLSINSKDLYTGIEKVVGAVSEKSFSPVLTGVCIYSEKGTLYFVGTDSFKLSEYKIRNTQLDDFCIIIPVGAIKSIMSVIKETQEEYVNIDILENQLSFNIGNIICNTLLIGGDYPKYRKTTIMPRSFDGSLTIKTKELKLAIKRSLSIYDKRCSQKYVNLKADGILTKNYENRDNIFVPFEESQGEIDLSLNGKYILDMVKNLNKDSVKFNYISQNSKIISVSETFGNHKYTYIMRCLQP